MDSRQVELSSCHTCLDCKLISRMKKEVKIFISVLDQDMEVITIRISEDTTAETVIKMVLHSVQMFLLLPSMSSSLCLCEQWAGTVTHQVAAVTATKQVDEKQVENREEDENDAN